MSKVKKYKKHQSLVKILHKFSHHDYDRAVQIMNLLRVPAMLVCKPNGWWIIGEQGNPKGGF